MQSYIVAPNVAFTGADAVPLHGHSLVADPWGRVLACCGEAGDDVPHCAAWTRIEVRVSPLHLLFPILGI